MQAAVVWTLLFATGHAALYGEDIAGWGEKRNEPAPQLLPGVVIPNMARCKDGFVAMTLVLGEVGARSFGSRNHALQRLRVKKLSDLCGVSDRNRADSA